MTDAGIIVPGWGCLAALQRYALAVLAPSSVSAAHLVVQVVLLATLTPAEFGSFAFLMIVVQFGYGLSNALVSTPYTVEVSSQSREDRQGMFFAANALFAVTFGLAVYLVGSLVGDGLWIDFFAIYAMLAMLRWFGRAHNYAMLQHAASGISDIVYAVTLVASVVALGWAGKLGLETVALAFILATLLGSLSLGRAFLLRQFSMRGMVQLSSYPEVWRGQSRWTLLGVITTETTGNIHSYLVTLLAGPAAFAPIGAAALFVRPVLLSVSSLMQLEIPILGRALAAGNVGRVAATRRRFLHALLAIWVGTVVLAYALITVFPSVIIKPAYSFDDVEVAVLLFMVISLFQVWQGPNSALLQAAKLFRELSRVSVMSCGFSIAGVAVALTMLPPVYSLAGIAIGQLIMAILLARLARSALLMELNDGGRIG